MGAALWWWLPAPEAWLVAPSWTRAGWMAVAVAGGAGLYVVLAVVLGTRPRHLLHRA
jgi:putative peptidoglycan lipid II flippase